MNRLAKYAIYLLCAIALIAIGAMGMAQYQNWKESVQLTRSVQSCEISNQSAGSKYTFVFHDEPEEEVTLSRKDADMSGMASRIPDEFGVYQITYHPQIFGSGRVIDDIQFEGYVENDANGNKIDYYALMEEAKGFSEASPPPVMVADGASDLCSN